MESKWNDVFQNPLPRKEIIMTRGSAKSCFCLLTEMDIQIRELGISPKEYFKRLNLDDDLKEWLLSIGVRRELLYENEGGK